MKFIIYLFLLSVPFKISANNLQSNTLDSCDGIYTRLSFLIPGISIEKGLSNNFSFFGELGTGYSKREYTTNGDFCFFNLFYNNSDNNEVGPFTKPFKENKFHPFFKAELRYYYILNYRQDMGKSIDNNSGNYFSFYNLYYFMDNSYFIGPTWGIQRNKNIFYFGLNLGGGVQFYGDAASKFSLLVDMKIGLLLSKN